MFDVGTPGELLALLNEAAAKPQTIQEIRLAPGDYGGLELKNLSFTSPVAIRSTDPDDPAVFSAPVSLTGVSNLILDDLRLSPADPEESQSQPALEIHLSSGITVTDTVLTGRIPDAGEGLAISDVIDKSDTRTPIAGYGHGGGIRVTDSTQVTLDGLELTQFRIGIGIHDSSDVSLTNSHLHHIREDGLRVSDISDVRISDNLMHSFQPLRLYDGNVLSDHADYIQYWGTHSEDGIRGLEISGNVLLQGDGGTAQGIFGRMNAAPGTADAIDFTDFEIFDNLISTRSSHGITLGDVTDAHVHHNTLLPAPGSEFLINTTPGIPRINIITDAREVSPGVYDAKGDLPGEMIVEKNIVVSRSGAPVVLDRDLSDAVRAGLDAGIRDNIIYDDGAREDDYWGDRYPGVAETGVTDIARLVGEDGHGVREIADWIVALVPTLELTQKTQTGTAGADRLVAAGGRSETLSGLAGDDTLIGGQIDDLLAPGAGSDTMTGGAGRDIFSLQADLEAPFETDRITDLDFVTGDVVMLTDGFEDGMFNDKTVTGNRLKTYDKGSKVVIDTFDDLVELARHDDITAVANTSGGLDLYFDFDSDGDADWRLRLDDLDGMPSSASWLGTVPDLSPDNDVDRTDAGTPDTTSGIIVLYGTGAGETLDPDQGQLRVFARGGDDIVRAANQRSIINGGQGDDTLYGGRGNDDLIGASGSDRLVGGMGADMFVFTPNRESAGSVDTIVNLNFAAGDRIRLNGFDAGTFSAVSDEGVRVLGDGGSAQITRDSGLTALNEVDGFSFRDGILGHDRDGDGNDEWQVIL